MRVQEPVAARSKFWRSIIAKVNAGELDRWKAVSLYQKKYGYKTPQSASMALCYLRKRHGEKLFPKVHIRHTREYLDFANKVASYWRDGLRCWEILELHPKKFKNEQEVATYVNRIRGILGEDKVPRRNRVDKRVTQRQKAEQKSKAAKAASKLRNWKQAKRRLGIPGGQN